MSQWFRGRRRSVRAVVATGVVTLGLPIAAATPSSPASAAPTELFFSEYIEGSSNNKALEIYNGTGAPVDLAAGGYAVAMYFNGATTPGTGTPINLTGTLADGDVFVLAHGAAHATILAQADFRSGTTAGWFNGDDAVVLTKAGAPIDVIGQVGLDPGTEWGTGLTSTMDNTLRRQETVCAGDTDGANAFDPAVGWTGFATDTFDGLGAHTTDCDGPVDQPPVATCPPPLSTPLGTATSASVTATDDVDGFASVQITAGGAEGISLSGFAPPVGAAQLDVAATTAAGSYAVEITFTTDAVDPQTATCTASVTVLAPPTITPISTVQGSGAASPIAGQTVTIEGIVTSLFTAADVPDGFFVQEEDDDRDDFATTSEAVFVFCRTVCPAAGALAVGDKVQVRGRVSEFFEMTQVSSNVSGGGIIELSSGHALPTATDIALPVATSTLDPTTYESTEGMVVRIPGTLAVSEYFELARFGHLVLTAGARPYQFTHTSEPSTAGYDAFRDDLATRRIYLDDDNNDQNDAIAGPQSNEPYPWPLGGLAINNRFRGGDTIADLTGVLHYSFAGSGSLDAWRIRPIPGANYTFTPTNPVPAPPNVGGDLEVASYNVLNYFATIDTTSSNNVGTCGPSGTLDCRGADSEAERVRQLDKIVAGLVAIDADVAGLIEIENDAGTATQQIVDALNARLGPGTFAAIQTGVIGTDAIKVAFIYQPAVVRPVGTFAILDSSDDARFLDNKNRPALIQTFEQVATGGRFTAAVNHFKSKGSDCEDVGDPDIGDGQGNCNITRTNAAKALVDHLATDPTHSGDPDMLILGDLNSYRNEDPIDALEEGGYTDLHELHEGDDAYSYVFDGQLGYLDTALANPSMLGQVTGTASWHINADEVPLFDYNDTIDDVGEASFERESTARPLYAPDPLRSSDHDPVVVGLFLATPERALADLQAALAGMTIPNGVKNALTTKLADVGVALTSGDDAAACLAVEDFAGLVTSQQGKKITVADANALLAGADEVSALIPC